MTRQWIEKKLFFTSRKLCKVTGDSGALMIHNMGWLHKWSLQTRKEMQNSLWRSSTWHNISKSIYLMKYYISEFIFQAKMMWTEILILYQSYFSWIFEFRETFIKMFVNLAGELWVLLLKLDALNGSYKYV